MALGSNSNYDNNKKVKDITSYSRTNFSNPASSIDPSKLSFDFWGGVIKLRISPKIESNTEFAKYDYNNSGEIYLSSNNAYMLSKIIESYLDSPNKFPKEGLGVKTKDSKVIFFSEFNSAKGPCIVIYKYDNNGVKESSYAYEFKQKFYSVTTENGENDFNSNKVKYYDDVPIVAIKDVLYDFYRSSNGAYAHSVLDYGRFNSSREISSLEAIAKTLGVSSSSHGTPRNFDSNNNSSQIGQADGIYVVDDIDSIDDI